MSGRSRIENEGLEGDDEAPSGLRLVSWVRTLRLWSGLVLFVFLTMHLINHALGLFGLEALNTGQTLRWAIWMNPLGTTLLYGALLTHFLLASWRIVSRRTLRMPADEAVQLAFGLLIPVLLLPHLMNTRIAGSWFGASGFYESVLKGMWPDRAVWQIFLVIVAWSHGVLGIAMALRHRYWFDRWRPVGFAIAILIPALAISGFIASGREARILPEAARSAESIGMRAAFERTKEWGWYGLGGAGLALALIVKFGYFRRRIGNKIAINYRGRGPIRVPTGTSVLEASRINNIPHPSLCRGRGRCSTCRVQILSGNDALPEPSDLEQATLNRVGAVKNVRLACQLRPTRDISIRILLPVLGRADDPDSQAEVERWAVERVATVLALDLRAFNVLVQSRLPYELVALVNRFGSEMRQAVENHGGKVSTFYGDGLVAVFDDPRHERFGARNAIAAAKDMERVLKNLSREMGGALPIPVRAGIGIHSGRVTLARIGMSERDSELMAFGPSVNIANSLQNATKTVLADCLCSEATVKLARIDARSLPVHEVQVDGSDLVVRAVAIADWEKIRRDDRKESDSAAAEAPAPAES
jgi:adenylate cyclase